ncbi:MAG: L-threonylcarbamoyladenylate synthase [Filifactor alocis]|nr:L-threonylcarbamoyladenylate synthase [Filifactor alocis]
MRAELIRIEDPLKEKEKMELASRIIRHGGIVIFPTETVYGLGANGLDHEAAHNIYQAKGRPSDNPLILHIADMEMLTLVARNLGEKAWKLAEVFWPGPLTMVFDKQDIVPAETTGGLSTVAVRMPSNEIALELIRRSDTPIAAPSANISGRPSITMWEDAVEEMGDRVDAILLSEPSEVGLESTIVDMTEDIPVILRPGKIGLSELEAVVGPVRVDKAVLGQGDAPKAPGMKYTHYSPNASVYVVKGEGMVERILEEYRDHRDEDPVIFAMEKHRESYKGLEVYLLGETSLEAAKVLFSYLRKADKEGHRVVLMEDVGEDEVGLAVMNRAEKAAGGQIIYANSTQKRLKRDES